MRGWTFYKCLQALSWLIRHLKFKDLEFRAWAPNSTQASSFRFSVWGFLGVGFKA